MSRYLGPIVVPTQKCVFCERPGSVEMTDDQYARYTVWRGYRASGSAGHHIQSLLFDLDAGLREQLLNGTHPECFDAMFLPEAEIR